MYICIYIHIIVSWIIRNRETEYQLLNRGERSWESSVYEYDVYETALISNAATADLLLQLWKLRKGAGVASGI